ncbi:hypothetical protein JB92DRAFT_2839266, partial [Gautieria morchelliformis]
MRGQAVRGRVVRMEGGSARVIVTCARKGRVEVVPMEGGDAGRLVVSHVHGARGVWCTSCAGRQRAGMVVELEPGGGRGHGVQVVCADVTAGVVVACARCARGGGARRCARGGGACGGDGVVVACVAGSARGCDSGVVVACVQGAGSARGGGAAEVTAAGVVARGARRVVHAEVVRAEVTGGVMRVCAQECADGG